MKRLVLSLFACLLLASVSFAQQNPADAPASKEDIEKYLEIINSRNNMKAVMNVMAKQMHQMAVERAKKDPSLPPDYAARMDKAADDLIKDLPIDELIDAMIPVYQNHLTKSDVDNLVAFYSSPTGKKFIREMPAIMSEAMKASTGIMQKMIAKTMQRVDDEVALEQKKNDANSAKKPQQN